VLRQATANGCLTVSQIRELLKLYLSEYDRLELAKYLWHRCWDPQNFFQVNDSFNFSSSTRDLETYTRANPR
jgi:hypothetical protein